MINVRPVVVCGPSGVGKSTLLGKLLKEYPDKFGFSVSHTSRAPRPNEVYGVNYYFLPKEQILAEVAEGKFVEHAVYAGNVYGTSKMAIENVIKTGKICILDIDIQGAISVKKTDLHAHYVLIAPPSLEVLEQRLRGRGDTSDEAIKKRLSQAQWELSHKDIPGFFDKVIVNGDLDVAFKEFTSFCMLLYIIYDFFQ